MATSTLSSIIDLLNVPRIAVVVRRHTHRTATSTTTLALGDMFTRLLCEGFEVLVDRLREPDPTLDAVVDELRWAWNGFVQIRPARQPADIRVTDHQSQRRKLDAAVFSRVKSVTADIHLPFGRVYASRSGPSIGPKSGASGVRVGFAHRQYVRRTPDPVPALWLSSRVRRLPSNPTLCPLFTPSLARVREAYQRPVHIDM